MKDVLFSIIVPVYQAEKTISRCIESVLDQTMSCFELLLIDDGCSDKSGAICDKYALRDSRIKVIHKKNGGVSSARNEGIKKAIGRWITFIDSDDWVDKDYLKNFEILHINEDDLLVYQGVMQYAVHLNRFIDFFSYPCMQITSNDYGTIKKIDLFKDGCPYAKLFNRKIIIENKLFFDEKVSLNEDHMFVLNYCCYVKNYHLKAYRGYFYSFDFKNDSSLTKRKYSIDNYLYSSKKIYEIFKKLCQTHCCSPTQVASPKTLRIFGFQQISRAMGSISFGLKAFEEYVIIYSFLQKKTFFQKSSKTFFEKISLAFFLNDFKILSVCVCWMYILLIDVKKVLSFYKKKWMT